MHEKRAEALSEWLKEYFKLENVKSLSEMSEVDKDLVKIVVDAFDAGWKASEEQRKTYYS